MTSAKPRRAPQATLLALILALATHMGSNLMHAPPSARITDLDPPPAEWVLRLTALGDPVPVAKILMLGLQAFDLNSANRIPYQALDYGRLISWLSRILSLDPMGQYPLHAASRIYADVPDESRQRRILNFVFKEFFKDPNRRWPWLAQAASTAKHHLKDMSLARTYAAAIQRHATAPNVPLWAKQMEIFILEDMSEYEEAKLMIGGFIDSGLVTDPSELRFLEERLKQLESASLKTPP